MLTPGPRHYRVHPQWAFTVLPPGLRAEVNGRHHLPWGWLIATLLLALLAVGFVVAARRFDDHRFGWLLSGSVAAGLAIADFYNFIDMADAPVLPAAALVAGIGILLLVARAVTRTRPRR
jgi:hypothetical protein